MTLYVDESGNTGETLIKELQFNFKDQPYYVLTGLLIDDKIKTDFQNFINNQKIKFNIKACELKAKRIYEKKSHFLFELIEYIHANKIPIFIELIDKIYYLNIQLVEHFIIPYYSLPPTDETFQKKRHIASYLSQFLNFDVYEEFINTCKNYTNIDLENFYDFLITYFDSIKQPEFKKNIILTRKDYFEKKVINGSQALKEFLPLPDKNPNDRFIYLLPNFGAFTNIIARVQKYISEIGQAEFEIIHDEQKQFNVIYESALKTMQTFNFGESLSSTSLKEKVSFKIDKSLNLKFEDSKSSIFLQVTDLISGFIMRFWSDFVSKNETMITLYLPIIPNLANLILYTNLGINFVVPQSNLDDLNSRLWFKAY